MCQAIIFSRRSTPLLDFRLYFCNNVSLRIFFVADSYQSFIDHTGSTLAKRIALPNECFDSYQCLLKSNLPHYIYIFVYPYYSIGHL